MSADATSLLVCAATPGELDAFDSLGDDPPLAEAVAGFGSLVISRAVTGVGVAETFFRLLPTARRLRPDRILNIGIAGAYPGSGMKIGDIVRVEAELFGDVGFELPESPGFRPIISTNMDSAFYREPMRLPLLPEPGSWLASHVGVGCTVNCCAGTDETGIRRGQQWNAHVETMEGAGVALIGRMLNIPVYEVRAISNIAARRDMRPENIAFAISRLRVYLGACRVG